MKNVITLIAIGCLGVFGFTSTALAGIPTNFGSGPGCSAIEGVDATSINDGDFFEVRIGTTGVTRFNKNGKPADDADSDTFTDSLEMCISDALHGYCTLVFTANTNIAISGISQVGRNGQQSLFTITNSRKCICKCLWFTGFLRLCQFCHGTISYCLLLKSEKSVISLTKFLLIKKFSAYFTLLTESPV